MVAAQIHRQTMAGFRAAGARAAMCLLIRVVATSYPRPITHRFVIISREGPRRFDVSSGIARGPTSGLEWSIDIICNLT